MDLKGRKLVLIGGAGLIGSHTADQLLAEDVGEIVIYDNFVRGRAENLANVLKDPRARVFEIGGDILQTDILDAALAGADGVFHFAALWLLQCHEYPRSAFDVNVRGTFNVIEACVRNKVRRLVYSSSASVYGDAVELPMTEEHPFNNKNFYGATKIAGEAMATAFNDRYGLPVIGLRYMNVYGPNQDQTAAYTGVIPIMLNKIDENVSPVINGDGSQAYDFIYVEDVARCNVMALKSEVAHGFYNVGTEVQTSIKSLCDLILKLKSSDLKVTYKPYSADDARALVQNRIGSAIKAEKELGFKYKYTLEQGLNRLIEWRDKNKKAQLA